MINQKTNDVLANKIDQVVFDKRVKANTDAIKFVMSDKRGRRFVSQVLTDLGQTKKLFDTNGLQMAYNVGEYEDYLYLKTLIVKCAGFDLYSTMEKEDIERQLGEEEYKQLLIKKEVEKK